MRSRKNRRTCSARQSIGSCFILILFALLLVVVGCSPKRSFEPLQGTTKGIVALRWGDEPDVVRRHLADLQGVELSLDTVILQEYVQAFQSPDSVFAPIPNFPEWRYLRFKGGTFFDYPVVEWELSFSERLHLRSIRLVLGVDQSEIKSALKEIGSRFARLYGTPRWTDERGRSFDAGGWNERVQEGARPTTSVGVMWWRVGPSNTESLAIGFGDRRWSDSSNVASMGIRRKVIHISAWEAAVKEARARRKR